MPDKENKGKGVDNLIPLNKRTKDEQRDIAAMGGVASGESRRRKKQFKTVLNEIMKLPVVNETHIKNLHILGIDEKDATLQTVMAAAVIGQACNGNVKAYVAVRDTIGEIPKAKVEFDGTVEEKTDEAREAYEEVARTIKNIGFE